MEPQLGAGEDPSRFACSKLTGAPFYDRGRSKSGDRPAGAALERLPRLHRAGGRVLVHSKVKKEIRQKSKKTTLSESFLMLFWDVWGDAPRFCAFLTLSKRRDNAAVRH